jgi:hypothetical protein
MTEHTCVELIWKPIYLNSEFIPIPQMDVELLRYPDFNYVASRLKTNRWANLNTQFNFLSW